MRELWVVVLVFWLALWVALPLLIILALGRIAEIW
jgi:hypothetical protein